METILVVDDDACLRSLLQRGLSRAGYAVEAVGTAEAALEALPVLSPALVVLDIVLPGFDGLEVLRRLRAANLPSRVLLLTGKTSSADEVWGIESGADDYVKKPFVFEVLLARIRALLRWRAGEQAAVLRYADVAMDMMNWKVSRGRREISLTRLEYRLLGEFLAHPNQVMSKATLLDRVWGYDVGSANLVEVYVKQLRQKLEAGNDPRLIHTVYGVGYVLR